MFPAHLRDQLINRANTGSNTAASSKKRNLVSVLTGEKVDEAAGADDEDSAPLADLFLETTDMFAGKILYRAASHWIYIAYLIIWSFLSSLSTIQTFLGKHNDSFGFV